MSAFWRKLEGRQYTEYLGRYLGGLLGLLAEKVRNGERQVLTRSQYHITFDQSISYHMSHFLTFA